MIELDGQLREAHGGRTKPVVVHAFEDGELHVEGAGPTRSLSAKTLRIGARAKDGSRAIALPDGATLALNADDELELWVARVQGGEAGAAAVRTRRALRAAGSMALTIGLIFAVVKFGVPAAASLVARGLPHAVDVKLGESVADTMDASFGPSELSEARRAEIRALFGRMRSFAPLAVEPRLEFRAGGAEVGANAFALPHGAIVVTDELVALAESDDELAAVLAHELGHVHHRHGVRALLQALGIGALAAGALGDFSGLAAAAPALLQLSYSREFEHEADGFAQRILAEAQLDPRALSRMLARLEAASGTGAIPAYLSTHPPAEERGLTLDGPR
ncbi:MAG: M48 family metallopeptidase [Deltaproteobacteria bacterium]|nr:M48 family metallopeptidase [Deltaproteobacteria bacterium]